jgi:hypothetical protein
LQERLLKPGFVKRPLDETAVSVSGRFQQWRYQFIFAVGIAATSETGIGLG